MDAPPPLPAYSADMLSPAEFARRAHRFTPRIWVTPALVAINAAVFLAMCASGVSFVSPTAAALLRWGGNLGYWSIGQSQSWRLVSCIFVHAGILHIGMNMAVLWYIGRFIERLLGNTAMLITYILAGLVGSLASALFHPDVVSVGASGAIFGLYGALFGFLLRHRHTIPPGMLKSLGKSGGAFVLYNLVFSAAVPGIDLSAHLGGLVGGFVAGAAIAAPLDEKGAHSRLWRNTLVGLVGFAAIAFAVRGLQGR